MEPGNALLLAAKGRLLARTGDREGARQVLEAAVAADAAAAQPRVSLAELHLAAGETSKAIEHLQAATRIQPRAAPTWTRLAEALGAAGRKREAIAAFQMAIKQEPRAGAALLGLARLHLPEDPDEALRLLRRLQAVDPGQPGLGDTLKAARAAQDARTRR
jgi:predicted Zn-dependent protease